MMAIDLDGLRQIWDAESQSDAIKSMDNAYYDDVKTYLGSLEKSKNDATDPDEEYMIDNELVSARRLVQDIFERRMSKILDYAAIVSDGTSLNIETLTPTEKAVFDDMVAILKKCRKELLEKALEHRT